ncbi:uncharacterized protein EV154DRAFT_128038 [Mucor mucedo]|uniref:uncharacterized protein n=1 Tax=Mucor mucedo TaxID=29922 RepID=UPI00221E79E3|nr:uncharacterized protein EV154DRAFT_128038 [Mucor mucedo]KAI7869813.1 hypothetical protein EV154DRAFT_128038 [Mucor mucedo]
MATKRKGKTVPCEGCRERKKKCSAGQPCERCKRLGIPCQYLKPVAPPRIECVESVNSQEIQLRVQAMEDIMRAMEKEMFLLKSPLVTKQHDFQPDNALSDEGSDKSIVMDDSKSITKLNNNIAAKWELQFGKDGGFSINTDIQSYTSLLRHIEALSTESAFCPIIRQPMLASLSVGDGFLHKNMVSTVLRKGNFRITIASIQKTQLKQIPQFIEPPPVLLQQKGLSLQLVQTYFACRFLHRVIFHQATFYDLFVNNYADPESSPVVCALSAAVLTMRCKHIMNMVPYDQQMELGEYFFNKARQAVSLQFDEATIETMIVYLHMALYKSNLLRPQEAHVYLDMAIRIRQILAEDTFKHPPTSSESKSQYAGEYENFKRLHAGFQDAVRFIQFVNNQRGVPVKSKNRPPRQEKPFQKVFRSICAEEYKPTAMPDEPQQTVRAIMKENYLNYISGVVGPYFRRVRFGQEEMIPLSFLLKTEQDLHHVYNHKLPLEYRLSHSIFEDGLSDVEFRRRLQDDTRCDAVTVSIATRFHQSLLALHEPFLPVMKRPPVLAELSMLQEDAPPPPPPKKRKRKSKVYNSPGETSLSSTHSISSSSSEDSDDYDDNEIISAHSLRAQDICHKGAITVIRLLEYQCMTLGSCTIPIASLLCAWDILIRDSCLGMTLDDLKESGASDYLTPNDIRLAREYAVRCIEVLRRGYVYNGAEREIWEHYERIEVQLLKALCTDASPTAKYWEPVSTWY